MCLSSGVKGGVRLDSCVGVMEVGLVDLGLMVVSWTSGLGCRVVCILMVCLCKGLEVGFVLYRCLGVELRGDCQLVFRVSDEARSILA